MDELNKETNTHMRVLHEEVISRIALLGEARSGRKPIGPTRGHKPRRPKR